MNIANKLTLSRILLIPIYIALFLADFNGHYFYAVAVYALASFTDFLDGYLARSRNLISSFGKFADPLADKMLVTAALLCFMLIGRINVWVVFLILFREFAATGLRAAVAADGVVLAAGKSGKLKTVVQLVGLIYLHFEIGFHISAVIIGDIFIGLMLLLTIVSGAEYFYKNRKKINMK